MRNDNAGVLVEIWTFSTKTATFEQRTNELQKSCASPPPQFIDHKPHFSTSRNPYQALDLGWTSSKWISFKEIKPGI